MPFGAATIIVLGDFAERFTLGNHVRPGSGGRLGRRRPTGAEALVLSHEQFRRRDSPGSIGRVLGRGPGPAWMLLTR